MDTDRLTKNERRAQAREQARLAREAERKREKRKGLFIKGGVALAIVAVLAVIALLVTTTLRPAGAIAAPNNMATGGAIFGKDLKIKETGKLPESGEFKATEFNPNDRPVTVRLFLDFMCPACNSFEKTYGSMLEQYAGAGDIELEIYPLNFLDGASSGTKYSSRAANAFACVVDEQPDKAYAFHKKLFEVQPAEHSSGLTDQQLLDYAIESGVEKTDTFVECINKRTFVNFVDKATKQVLQDEVLGLAEGEVLLPSGKAKPEGAAAEETKTEPQRVGSTPTVIVDGKQWYQPRDGDLEQYLLKILQQLNSESN